MEGKLKRWYLVRWNLYRRTEAYLEPCQTSKMERFAKMLTIFLKSSILDVWQGSEYASMDKYLFKVNINNSKMSMFWCLSY